jgi:hypothetical protein
MRRVAAVVGVALCGLALAGPALWRAQAPFLAEAQALAAGALFGSARPALRHLVTEVVGPNGNRALVVTGDIVNGTGRAIALSPLEFLVRNGDEKVLVTWTSAPPQPTLRPGETARFEARLSEPPAQGRDVQVQFTKARAAAYAALTD